MAGSGTLADPFILVKGGNFSFRWDLVDADGAAVSLAGYTGRAEMRPSAAHTGTPTATFTVTTDGGVTGRASVSLDAAASETGASPEIAPGLYVCDVEYVNDGDATDVLKGMTATPIYIRVVGEVTK